MRDPSLMESFDRNLIRDQPVDYRQNVLVYEALYREARALGIFPLKDPLDGIDVDLHLARVLNVRTNPREDR
jgi:hypothetical protein